MACIKVVLLVNPGACKADRASTSANRSLVRGCVCASLLRCVHEQYMLIISFRFPTCDIVCTMMRPRSVMFVNIPDVHGADGE